MRLGSWADSQFIGLPLRQEIGHDARQGQRIAEPTLYETESGMGRQLLRIVKVLAVGKSMCACV